MGMIHAEIELTNVFDRDLAHKNLIGQEEIRRITVVALVDSGAYMMAINENIQEILQLPFVEKKTFQLANAIVGEFDIVGPLEVRFKNRRSACNAIVMPGDAEPLLGSIPMEEMDVLIDPLRQELLGNPKHPDGAVLRF